MKHEFYDINKDIHSFSPMTGDDDNILMVICRGYIAHSPFEPKRWGRENYIGNIKPKIPTEMLYKSRIVIMEIDGVLDVQKCNIDNPQHKKFKSLDGFFDGFFDNLVDEARQPGNILIGTDLSFDLDSVIDAIKTCYAFRRKLLLL
jgi:hypothetical protein